MSRLSEKLQNSTQLVDVTNWQQEEEYGGIFAKGAREKTVLFCPDPAKYNFLIPKHRYIFKQSSHRYPEQYWVEVFTYRLACLMNVSVPPAFVAYNNTEKINGALIEWFHGKAIDGGGCMKNLIENYDLKKGKQHNFEAIIKTAQAFKIKSFAEAWAKILTFDSVIGNTDRHHDNWGVILYLHRLLTPTAKFSPAFDNGTSMGHEILEKDFFKFDDPAYLKRYVQRGHHHMRWSYPEDKVYNHAEFLQRFLEEFPEQRKTIFTCLNFTRIEVEKIAKALTKFETSIPLSLKRADFMVKLVEYRKNWVYNTINS